MPLDDSENLTELEDIFLVSSGNCSITHLRDLYLSVSVCMCVCV